MDTRPASWTVNAVHYSALLHRRVIIGDQSTPHAEYLFYRNGCYCFSVKRQNEAEEIFNALRFCQQPLCLNGGV